jgi:hypothetical protein
MRQGGSPQPSPSTPRSSSPQPPSRKLPCSDTVAFVWRYNAGVGCLSASAILVVLLALAGCSGGGEDKQAQSPSTTTSHSSTPQTPDLEPRPSNCPGPRPKRVPVDPEFGPLNGKRPAWGGVYAPYNTKTNSFRLPPDTPHTKLGWRVKILWVVAPKQRDPITLSGRQTGSEESIWFEIDQMPATTYAILPANTTEYFADFPSYVYFPSAGCYSIEARWPDGSWRLGFGVGS